MIHINKKNTIETRVYSKGASQTVIDMAKKTLLFDAIRNHTELVKETKLYPKDEMQEVVLQADFVILTKEEYFNLMSR